MKTLELIQLQTAFHDHLLNLPSAITDEIIDGGRITVDHRLHIYHNAYRMRLLENLQDAFEKTMIYLGDTAFESCALAFIEENAPQHRNLRWHGATFPAWLAAHYPQDTDIAELAVIDWQLRQAFDGLNATPINLTDLSTLTVPDWETVGFQFAPTLFITPLRYNSITIWHALNEEQIPPTAELLPTPSWLLIWRKGWQPHFRTIHSIEHAALTQLLSGTAFAQMCIDLDLQFPDMEAATVAAGSLATWVQDELIVGMTGTQA